MMTGYAMDYLMCLKYGHGSHVITGQPYKILKEGI